LITTQDGNGITIFFPENENKVTKPFVVDITSDHMILYCNNKDFTAVLEKKIDFCDAIVMHNALSKIFGRKPRKFDKSPKKKAKATAKTVPLVKTSEAAPRIKKSVRGKE
jgi:hypothetical protein